MSHVCSTRMPRKPALSRAAGVQFNGRHTRPDVAYAVGMLCRAMSRPTPALYKAALRVLYYLYRHRHIGLRYEPSAKALEGYSDSDWAVRRRTPHRATYL